VKISLFLDDLSGCNPIIPFSDVFYLEVQTTADLHHDRRSFTLPSLISAYTICFPNGLFRGENPGANLICSCSLTDSWSATTSPSLRWWWRTIVADALHSRPWPSKFTTDRAAGREPIRGQCVYEADNLSSKPKHPILATTSLFCP